MKTQIAQTPSELSVQTVPSFPNPLLSQGMRAANLKAYLTPTPSLQGVWRTVEGTINGGGVQTEELHNFPKQKGHPTLGKPHPCIPCLTFHADLLVQEGF